VLRHRLRHAATALIVTGCLAGIGIPFFGGPPPRAAPPRGPRSRPDIVLITIDALRADHVSAYGYRRLTTPAIDRRAARGVVFSNAITQAPYTKAAIASLMSGLYPSSHKTVTATVPYSEAMSGRPATAPISTDVLPSGITTLAEALHDGGYRTLGFTANPFLIDAFGFGQGFERFQFYPGAEFATVDRLVDGALAGLRDSDRRPLFLWVHVMEPHSPYVPPAWARWTLCARRRAAHDSRHSGGSVVAAAGDAGGLTALRAELR
jgi:arylsulfatase A-like enzyme